MAFKLSNKEFINKANEVHNDEFDYSEIKYINSRTKIKIIHKDHYFEQTPFDHLRYKNCPICLKQSKLTKENFFEKILNFQNLSKYKYIIPDNINLVQNTIIKTICPTHGEFSQYIHNVLKGRGCSSCAKRKRLTKNQFIEMANKIHNNKFDYSKIIYINHKTKIEIICHNHEQKYTFYQKPNDHLNGYGCNKCFGNKKSNTQEFIEKANKIHNHKYDYSLVNYTNATTKIKIICNNHYKSIIFIQSPNKHLHGRGCSVCGRFISKIENSWLDKIEKELKIKLIRQYYIKSLKIRVDGYDPTTNTIYEFYGDFWHGNPKRYNLNNLNKVTKTSYKFLYQKTLEKEFKIIESGYNLVVKWESDIN